MLQKVNSHVRVVNRNMIVLSKKQKSTVNGGSMLEIQKRRLPGVPNPISAGAPTTATSHVVQGLGLDKLNFMNPVKKKKIQITL